jgi:hypothetical protein
MNPVLPMSSASKAELIAFLNKHENVLVSAWTNLSAITDEREIRLAIYAADAGGLPLVPSEQIYFLFIEADK